MSFLPARKGRHRQRYQDHLRLVAGCIPYRLQKDVEDRNSSVTSRINVLMISTPNRDDLVFPKGGWENDETVHEAACREALEEAGVKGILDVYMPYGMMKSLIMVTPKNERKEKKGDLRQVHNGGLLLSKLLC